MTRFFSALAGELRKHAMEAMTITAFCALLLSTAGCATEKTFRMGQDAEQRGDAHVAYDYYYRHLQKNPSDAKARSGIQRIAPTAAAYWCAQAKAALAEERYADSWRQAMRCLDIRPDHSEALAMIRKLEHDHSSEIASAQSEYQHRGLSSLPASKSSPFAAAPAVPPEQTTVAEQPFPATATDPVESSVVNKSSVLEKPSKDVEVDSHSDDYLVVRMLSKEDRRYRAIGRILDGVMIRLTDTDDDGDADFDIYIGNRRISKVRGLEECETSRFRGRSGQWYALKLIHVDDDSHTVKIGILRATR